ncbi:Type IV secretion-system coupling protein DNA-binding domain protein (plasmid) [Janthinobacterium sp. HH102]|uniref:type IV secretion system DNA-binding domain-containing protein n=1 Tax=Janthinobacterium sp. HH102 TaxID=1537274 RepID=UPI000892F1E2|nr:type IV secretion system DNA-binding domain-containing protein [Janthinobacterium sp. HH102]QOU76447.1 Type IV secretion-system coupling protein DNA-binding domain protein [Janthinobacterium sp. HH102]
MSAGQKRRDDRNNAALFFLIIVIAAAMWVYAVNMTFSIPKEKIAAGYFYALLATLTDIKLWLPPLFGIVFGMIVAVQFYIYYKTGFNGGDFISKLRGPDMVSAARLKDITKEYWKKQLSFMGIPVPTSKENQHYAVAGSTGTGKSQAISAYIESAHARGDQTVCVDPNGGFMEKFWKEGDFILNPFDARTQSWSIFNEIKTAYDVEQYAVSMIPKSPTTEGEQWNAMARTIVAEVMLKLVRVREGTTEKLVYWLVEATNEQLQKMLAGTSAAGMFHGAEETLGSVRAVLTRYVVPHKFLSVEPGQESFSIRKWLESGTGNLWITWREDMLEATKPLISCWIDVICASSLSSNVEAAKDMHLIIDELDSLSKLNYLIQAATKGRKHLFKIFAGFQSLAQLDETNGKNDALTLRNSLRNFGCLGVSEGDTFTTEEVSKGLGEHEVLRKKISLSGGTMGAKAGSSIETNSERLVKPSEISGLPDLCGYLKLAGDIPVARIQMKHKKRVSVTEPMIIIKNKWTTDLTTAAKNRLKFGVASAVI